jgi:hypothetical protein
MLFQFQLKSNNGVCHQGQAFRSLRMESVAVFLAAALAAGSANSADLFVSASGTWKPDGYAGTCYTDPFMDSQAQMRAPLDISVPLEFGEEPDFERGIGTLKRLRGGAGLGRRLAEVFRAADISPHPPSGRPLRPWHLPRLQVRQKALSV